jgi:ankyrin repeat protein
MTAGMSDDPLYTPFYTACYHGQFEAAKFLADNGARTALTDQAL